MKLICTTITLLLFTFSVHAQLKLEITPGDSKYAKMSIDCSDQSDCDSKLVKWIDKQKFFKGKWKDKKKDSIASRVEESELGANVTRYFHPSNFTVQLVDMTAVIADKEAKKAAKKAKRKALKASSLKKRQNESVGEWRDRVADTLDEILKDLGEE